MLKRFFVILTLSILGLTVTRLWYVLTKKDYGEPEREAIAFLKEDHNLVEQKFADRLIWKDIRSGQPLYHGDYVRTAQKSEGEVVFLRSGAGVFLHENTIIIIEEMLGEASLSLLSGSLFAQSTSVAGTPKIKAGESHFTLTEKSALRVSVDEQNVHAHISKGKVSMKTKEEEHVVLDEGASGRVTKSGLDENALIKIISPGPNDVFEKGSSVDFSWEVVKEGIDVVLRMGAHKQGLKRVAVGKDKTPLGSINAQVPGGVFYWQLAAMEDGKEIRESLVFRGHGVKLSAPELFHPLNKAVVETFDPRPTMKLSWKLPQRTRQVKLEIAEDADFKKPYIAEVWEERTDATIVFDQNKSYFWRVTAEWEGPFAPKTSSVRQLSFVELKHLRAPKPLLPENDETFVLQQVEPRGLAFEWIPVSEVSRYRLKVQPVGEKEQVIETRHSVFRLKDIKAMKGVWSVQAFDDVNVSPWSEERRFAVIRARDVAWLEPKERKLEYVSPKPSVNLAWSAIPGVAQWRLTCELTDGLVPLSIRKELAESELRLELEEGLWDFKVEGFDEKGLLVAFSQPWKLKLEPSPVIPPPKLEVQTRFLQASRNGTYFLNWNAVTRAFGYELDLLHKDLGRKKITTPETAYRLTNLMPGKYALKIRSRNLKGVPGRFSEEYSINVPSVSDIKAPEIERIVIK